MQQIEKLIQLEAQSYIHKKILAEYTQKVKLLEPAPPSLVLDKAETVLIDPDEEFDGSSEKLKAIKEMMILSILLFPLSYYASIKFYGIKEILCQILGTISLIFSFLCLIYFVKTCIDYKKTKKRILSNYRINKAKYILEQERLEKVNQWNDIKSEVYEGNTQEYEEKLNKHHTHYLPIFSNLNQIDQNLDTLLKKEYKKISLESRYQNLIALCSIKDYLEQNRCQSIEEASQLFLTELRSCKVIALMKEIEIHTESIKENQPTLYAIIQDSYSKVYDILDRSYQDEVILQYCKEQETFLENYCQ